MFLLLIKKLNIIIIVKETVYFLLFKLTIDDLSGHLDAGLILPRIEIKRIIAI